MIICLGETIRNLRISKGITQEKFGYEMGVSAQAVSRWENGATYPDITMLPTIADFFDVTLDALMGRCKELEWKERNEFFQRVYHLQENGQLTQIAEAYRANASQIPKRRVFASRKGMVPLFAIQKIGRPRPCERNHFSMQQDQLHQQARYAMRRKRIACTHILQNRRTQESNRHRKRITLLRSRQRAAYYRMPRR